MSNNLNKGMFSSNTEMWGTPQYLFNDYDVLYDFNTDVCAVAENAKCKHFYSPETDGLSQKWSGTVWMNPPYGRKMGLWIEKAYKESLNGVTVVALLPARTDTKHFHNYIYNKDHVVIEFIKGRVQFINAEKKMDNAPFPSMIVIFKGQTT